MEFVLCIALKQCFFGVTASKRSLSLILHGTISNACNQQRLQGNGDATPPRTPQ